MFVTLKNGLETLVERLLQQLTGTVDFALQTRVQHILRRDEGGYDIVFQRDGTPITVQADVIVITTPAFAAADLLSSLGMSLPLLRSIRYVSTATVIVGYRQDPSVVAQFSGFLVPPHEKNPLTACTVVSNKWPHAVRPGQTVYRGYVGRDGDEGAVEWDDDSLIQTTHGTLEHVLGTLGSPEMSLVTRWPQAMPQYDVGHVTRVNSIDEQLRAFPGILLAGAAYRGSGIPDCIKDGTRAATQALQCIERN